MRDRRQPLDDEAGQAQDLADKVGERAREILAAITADPEFSAFEAAAYELTGSETDAEVDRRLAILAEKYGSIGFGRSGREHAITF